VGKQGSLEKSSTVMLCISEKYKNSQ